MIRSVRISLSSPGDVAEERHKARDLLLGLARGPFVRGRVLIDVVSWDDPHDQATMDERYTPQQAVDRSLPMPADCDVTVVLLWGRMGTPLTEKKTDGSGGSPYGALDMAGNVWNWTRSLWGKDFEGTHEYPYQPGDAEREDLLAPDDIPRVVRGGTFNYPLNFMRAAFRGRYDPDLRDGNLGFRLASSRLRPSP